ncbi:hypothetical protein, partial [Acinetobacter baumannii]|uniref:hypothetical protein n=1 Tax=Acinetobacter baumannii TaxID=470 RepID=UPI002FE06A42
LLFVSGGSDAIVFTPMSTGTFYPQAFYKIVNNFETTNGKRFCPLLLVTSKRRRDYQKKAGRQAGFLLTSPGGECRSAYC